MNIFYLHECPIAAANMHCDKHVRKMIIEYCQLLSTAHRVLDGEEYNDKTKNNRKIKRWRLHDSRREKILYKATHVNHPSAKWVRQSTTNYIWVYECCRELCKVYNRATNKTHGSEAVLNRLYETPDNIRGAFQLNQKAPPQAMPEEYHRNDTVEAYREYYICDKAYMATWKYTEVPLWFARDSRVYEHNKFIIESQKETQFPHEKFKEEFIENSLYWDACLRIITLHLNKKELQ